MVAEKLHPPPDNFAEEGQVLVAPTETSPEEMFGLSAEEMPGKRVETGETVSTGEGTVIVVDSGGLTAGTGDAAEPVSARPKETFDVGSPIPLGGASFGMGVVSTPTAEVGGKKQNPFATKDIETLLQSEQATSMLSQAGLTDGDDVEWLRGPNPATFREGKDPDHIEMLDEEGEFKSFVGIVNGDEGPWGVGLHVARVLTDGEAVIAAGGQRTPVGTAEGELMDKLAVRSTGNNPFLKGGAKLTVETCKRLEYSG